MTRKNPEAIRPAVSDGELDDVIPVSDPRGVLHQELTVIEVADPNDLTGLLADPRLAGLVLARIGSTAAVVEPRSLPRLLTVLLKAGHTPTVLGDS